jgi:hypothetical protein
MGGDARVLAGLRRWADGSYPAVAAVELLARLWDGRFAHAGWPWVVVEDSGWTRLDGEALLTQTGVLSGGERRALAVVGSLAGGGPVDLSDVLCGVDLAIVAKLVTAMAAAGGHPSLLDLLDEPDDPDPGDRGDVDDLDPPAGADLSVWDGAGGPDDNPDDDPDHPDLSALWRAMAARQRAQGPGPGVGGVW